MVHACFHSVCLCFPVCIPPCLQRDDGSSLPPLPEGKGQWQHESLCGGFQPGEGHITGPQISPRSAPRLTVNCTSCVHSSQKKDCNYPSHIFMSLCSSGEKSPSLQFQYLSCAANQFVSTVFLKSGSITPNFYLTCYSQTFWWIQSSVSFYSCFLQALNVVCATSQPDIDYW